MKSQDLGLMLKLACLKKSEDSWREDYWLRDSGGWQDWTDEQSPMARRREQLQRLADVSDNDLIVRNYTVRALAESTGISKSEVSQSLKRMKNIGLVFDDRKLDVPRVHLKSLHEFIVYGVKYIFPATVGGLVRGIATSVNAPVLRNKLMAGDDTKMVWDDAYGNTKGIAVSPLFKSAGYAVRQDPSMYALLSLIDAIRLGGARERQLSQTLIAEELGVKNWKHNQNT